MPQAIWTGTISFGLVSVPVKLYPATRRKDVRFHELDRLTGGRVRHQRVRPEPLPFEPRLDEVAWPVTSAKPVPETGPFSQETAAAREVTPDELMKGFEVTPGRYVAVSRQELAELAPERSRTIDVEQFVEASDLDPIYYDTSYYAVPEGAHARSFGLLLDAMRQTGKVAICWVMLRRKRHLASLRPHGRVMLLSTLFHADEVLSVDGLGAPVPADLTRKEKDMAALLVNTLSGPFEPQRYRDEYRDRVMKLIEGRAGSAQPAPPAPTSGRIQDLMAALKASVEQARQRKQKTRRKPAARRRRKSA